jgi:hypothetical protein
MMKQGAWSLLTIDAAGGAITALLLGIATWSVFSDRGGGLDSSHELRTALADAKNDLADLQTATGAQQGLAARYQAELAAAGAMPDQTPPETHLRILSGLAAENHLSVVRQFPLVARAYPGIMEQRFAYEVTGTMSDLARFFKAVELSPGWADISHLKVEQGIGADTTTDRNAVLTFSVFSVSKESQPAASQGT